VTPGGAEPTTVQTVGPAAPNPDAMSAYLPQTHHAAAGGHWSGRHQAWTLSSPPASAYANELASKISAGSGGQNIRLLWCQTGCPTGTFAQELADRMGVRVMAPTTDIGASGRGKTLTVFDGGPWRWFDPN
jgi:hypothetical protein